jgi:hypothetical protein
VYGVIGEDTSDVDTIKSIIEKLESRNVTIRIKGFTGAGEMLKRGATHLSLFRDLKCTRFIACYDSDGPDPIARKRKLVEEVFAPAGLGDQCCAVVPVHEIESWILADLSAVAKIIPGWQPKPFRNNPEAVSKPKEKIRDLVGPYSKPRYSHKTMNAAIARHLDLEIVRQRCPSFVPLYDFVRLGTGNIATSEAR